MAEVAQEDCDDVPARFGQRWARWRAGHRWSAGLAGRVLPFPPGPQGLQEGVELCWNLGDAVIRRRFVLACR